MKNKVAIFYCAKCKTICMKYKRWEKQTIGVIAIVRIDKLGEDEYIDGYEVLLDSGDVKYSCLKDESQLVEIFVEDETFKWLYELGKDIIKCELTNEEINQKVIPLNIIKTKVLKGAL